jgi:carboxymethylenebutenolidase
MSEFVTVKAADGHELSAYVAKPKGEVRGALVVVQEVFGVNAHIRSVADLYASHGYLSVAPSTFDRIERGVELEYEGEDMKKAFEFYGKLSPDTALLDVAAAFKHVSGEHKTAVLGFCYGGLMAWLSATRAGKLGIDPACTIGYYAGGIGSVAKEEPTCPVMLHFGADDDHIGKDQVDAVREAHPDVQVFVYEGAGHAFNRDVAPAVYRPEAAKLAQERSLKFLAENVG